jgi:hypothetical protein
MKCCVYFSVIAVLACPVHFILLDSISQNVIVCGLEELGSAASRNKDFYFH